MTNPTRTPPKPRRRFALSLRGLMLAVLVVGGLLGWRARRASIQRRAVAEIKAAGGVVFYDYQVINGAIRPNAPHPAPAWLRGSLGDEYFQEPEMVMLSGLNPPGGPRPVGETLDAVTRLDHLSRLQTHLVPIDDAAFARLAAMPRLARVSLVDVALTDEALNAVASSPALESLTLESRPGAITARGIERIARQARIKDLALFNVDLPDPVALAPLARLTRLETLRLWGSPQDDACLAYLKGLTGMKTIDLRQTRLTDSGLESLTGMRGLEALLVDGSKLTNAGMAKLARLAALKQLWIQPTTELADGGAIALGKVAHLNPPGIATDDAGLDLLANLKLEQLGITGRGVTDAGLARLAASHQFDALGLSSTGVTGAGLSALSGQSGLKSLALDHTEVDDAGVATLSALPLLQTLFLAETGLTDAGLLALVNAAPQLRYLDVGGTRVTPEGLAAARKLRTELRIDAEP